jgi:hypothetical protein
MRAKRSESESESSRFSESLPSQKKQKRTVVVRTHNRVHRVDMELFQCGSSVDCCHSENERRELQQSRRLRDISGKEWCREQAIKQGKSLNPLPCTIGGVGIYFRMSGRDLVVVGVNPDGPASASVCIQPGDRLLAIDNLQVLRPLSFSAVIDQLSSPQCYMKSHHVPASHNRTHNSPVTGDGKNRSRARPLAPR